MQHILSYRFFSKAFLVFSWILFLHCLIGVFCVEINRGGSYVSYEKFKTLRRHSDSGSQFPGPFNLSIRKVSLVRECKDCWTIYPREVELPRKRLGCSTHNIFVPLLWLVTIFLLLPATYLQTLGRLNVTSPFRHLFILSNSH